MPDTDFFRRLGPLTKIQDTSEECVFSGQTDGFKCSMVDHGVISNKTFLGYVDENCVDLVQCSYWILGPNVDLAKTGVATYTVKGNCKGVHMVGNFGTLEYGQYSDYDRWFKLPKSTGLTFTEDAQGVVYLWYADMPERVPPGVKIKDRRWLAYPYFLFRSIQQALTGK